MLSSRHNKAVVKWFHSSCGETLTFIRVGRAWDGAGLLGTYLSLLSYWPVPDSWEKAFIVFNCAPASRSTRI